MADINHQDYMEQVIAAAKKAQRDGGAAIGAVLVGPDGAVIATGESLVGVTHDPTAHAEINCIRRAAMARGSDDLFDCTLYSTLEPCHMCLSAAAWAKISQVYFGAYRKDVDESLFDITGDFSDETEGPRMNLRNGLTMVVHGGILETDCAALLADYHEAVNHTPPTSEDTNIAADVSPATE